MLAPSTRTQFIQSTECSSRCICGANSCQFMHTSAPVRYFSQKKVYTNHDDKRRIIEWVVRTAWMCMGLEVKVPILCAPQNEGARGCLEVLLIWAQLLPMQKNNRQDSILKLRPSLHNHIEDFHVYALHSAYIKFSSALMCARTIKPAAADALLRKMVMHREKCVTHIEISLFRCEWAENWGDWGSVCTHARKWVSDMCGKCVL